MTALFADTFFIGLPWSISMTVHTSALWPLHLSGQALPSSPRMRKERLSEVLTNDRHFEQEGFQALFRDS
jgi:hypothetical protein